MRFLFKASIPVEAGNAAAKDGFKSMAAILEQQKPEAVYFFAENGNRTALLILDMKDTSQIPAIAEPWFLAFNATVTFVPVMVPADLQAAGPAVEQAVKAFG
jgi:hypothetical protein